MPRLAALASGRLAWRLRRGQDHEIIGGDYPAPSLSTWSRRCRAGVDSFYQRYRDANGIPVLSSAAVADTAVASACVVVVRMLSARDDVRQTMIAQQMRVAVIARNEVTTDLPEHRDLYDDLPGRRRLERAPRRRRHADHPGQLCRRGERALPGRRPERGRERAGPHLRDRGAARPRSPPIRRSRPACRPRTKGPRPRACGRAPLRRGTPIQYFAEGVEDWFDTSPDVSPPDGVHNEINTREELQAYDPNLASLVKEAMPNDGWRPRSVLEGDVVLLPRSRRHHTKRAAGDVEAAAQVADDEVEHRDLAAAGDGRGGGRLPLHGHVGVGARVGPRRLPRRTTRTCPPS